MKILFDFFPVILFFVAYKWLGMSMAIFITIITILIQLVIHWLKYRHIEPMQWITALLIVILGGFSLLYHNEVFFKWKPTAVNWTLAFVFIGNQFVSNKPLIQRMMEKNVKLPNLVWSRLNLAWISFFMVMGAANLYVVYHFDTNTWVNFKLFGVLGLTLVFVILQAIYLARHIETEVIAETDQRS